MNTKHTKPLIRIGCKPGWQSAVRKQRMRSIIFKRIFEVPETWLSALLFPFKLFPVCAALCILIWYFILPPNNSGMSTSSIDVAFFTAAHDFRIAAVSVGLLDFLSASVLAMGGCIQLFKYSRSAAFWSIAFGVFAIALGIVMGRLCDWAPDYPYYLANMRVYDWCSM